MSEHTKVPWIIKEDKEMGMPRVAGPTKDNGLRDVIAVFPAMQEGKINEANAEFIVRACNAHEDLLAACKVLVDEMKKLNPYNRRDVRFPSKAELMGCAAIAKAEKDTNE